MKKLLLHARLRGQALTNGGWDFDVSCQPRIVIVGDRKHVIGLGIKENVVRVNKRHDQEKGLLTRGDRVEVGEDAFVALLVIAVSLHEPDVIVTRSRWQNDAWRATTFVHVLICACVLRVPTRKPILAHIGRHPDSIRVRWFAAMPLALVNYVVVNSGHYARDIWQIERKLDLRIRWVVRHVLLKGIFD